MQNIIGRVEEMNALKRCMESDNLILFSSTTGWSPMRNVTKTLTLENDYDVSMS